jgi:glycosyltransferase involved in cell wall biosynthesis
VLQESTVTRTARANYLFVIPVVFYRTGPGKFASESAFAEHLRYLKTQLNAEVERITIVAPMMTKGQYDRIHAGLAEIDEQAEGIFFLPLVDDGLDRSQFLMRLPFVLNEVRRAVEDADVVHGGISYNLFRPFEFPAILYAAALGKKTIVVEDIDMRNNARMNFKTGRWSRKSYLLNRYLYDPIRAVEHKLAARLCSLSLFKGKDLVSDYGKGRTSVKNFLDVAFFADQIIAQPQLETKIAACAHTDNPLQLVFAGRLTGYKGVDHCLRAVAHARDLGAKIHFTIIGGGEEDENLRRLAHELALEGAVTFTGPIPFGPRLFERLQQSNLLLGAPQSEDTPRNVFDAMASAVPVLAYDTYYYRDLTDTGAVQTIPWLDIAAMGSAIAEHDRDRTRLLGMTKKAVAFARENTQEIWLDRRIEWIKAIFATGN